MRKAVKFRAVVLAGGSGERFWPLSTKEKPKQFLNVFGGASLLRQSVTRLEKLASPEGLFVITAKDLVGLTRKELPEVPARQIVGEPMRRDTGAAIALGVGLAGQGARDCAPYQEEGRKGRGAAGKGRGGRDSAPYQEEVVGFFASDHLIRNEKAFEASVKKAIRLASQKDVIVVIGIPPTWASPAFGYVDPKTGSFVEKPDTAKAKTYLKKGYLWNAGLFIARASVFRAAIAANASALVPLTETAALTPAKLARLYEPLPRLSFDYAVMEKAKNVAVIRGDFGWDDVGGFQSFDRYFPHDAKGNVREGPCRTVDATDNICVVRGAPISLLGVSNLVVITTPQGVLVADKSRLADMKKLFQTTS